MLKSAVLFTKRPLHFIVFADDELRPMFETEVSDSSLTYTIVVSLGILIRWSFCQWIAFAGKLILKSLPFGKYFCLRRSR